ncbi:hypothetical protein LUZ60_004646 [Juncus effusus]|nr:hypothetical protein LUZ60_004646 [Juncus effusus]
MLSAHVSVFLYPRANSRRSSNVARKLTRLRVSDVEKGEPLDARTEEFNRLQDVPREERDRIQRQQLIDRAAAAIAAARALLSETQPRLGPRVESGSESFDGLSGEKVVLNEKSPPLNPIASKANGVDNPTAASIGLEGSNPLPQSGTSLKETPGPDFWSWAPPPQDETQQTPPVQPTLIGSAPQPVTKPDPYPHPAPYILLEKSPPSGTFLPIPFETSSPSLPPLQSHLELDARFLMHASEAVSALEGSGREESALEGVGLDGSKWWREKGEEERVDGVLVKWTLTRGVSSDESVEWEEKYWEASDRFDYKELGSEKSGRDARGNVWREFWKESMWQDDVTGLTHMEKSADKWGKNGNGEEWQEKWFEHYDASGKADKWAHKWCSIDPDTQLDPGHAHVWHERWGEKYDGTGGTSKYTDKWAERYDSDSLTWSKWGDKWDEKFDPMGHSLKQGETWWEGQNGQEKWNRTWGEGHDGTGWVHKFGKSSSGEHWDTHVREETWYEGFPHYGFENCYENSVQLRAVKRRLW